MYRGKVILATLPILTALTLGPLVRSALAQTTSPLNLTVSPPVIELSGNPGDTISAKFRIQNNNNQSVKLSHPPETN